LAIFPSNGGADVSFDGSAAAEPPNDHHEGADMAVAPLRQPGAMLSAKAQTPSVSMCGETPVALVREFDREW
jgi:hypothetical protein